MDVQVVLVDSDDNVLGLKEKYEAHRHPVPLHRAISVVIYNKNHQKMLLQKRSSDKPTWPGFWSNATCTHPRPQESYKDAAERRLFEEMGIKVKLAESYKFIYKAKYDETYGEHELDAVFVGEYGGPVKIDPKEVSDYKWMNISELTKDIKNNSGSYTPWFKLIMQRMH